MKNWARTKPIIVYINTFVNGNKPVAYAGGWGKGNPPNEKTKRKKGKRREKGKNKEKGGRNKGKREKNRRK